MAAGSVGDGDASAGDLFDAVLLPREALRALRSFGHGRAFVLRAYPRLDGATDDFGPSPAAPGALELAKGDAGVSMRRRGPLAEGGAWEATSARAVAIERHAERCCDAPGCTASREAITAWIELEGGERLVIAEGRPFEGQPDDGATAFAGALADALGVPLDMEATPPNPRDSAPRSAGEGDASSAPDDEPPLAPVRASELERYAGRTEAGRFVLRDHASVGPKAGARSRGVVAAVLGVLALGLWIPAAQAAFAGAGGHAAGFGSVATLLSIASFAFSGIARFAARYVATSVPLATFGRGRFVIAPWVARGGAVDLRLEGRLGAAIPCAEVSAVGVASRDADSDLLSVFIESDHGAMDVVSVVDPALAVALAAAVERAVASRSIRASNLHRGNARALERLHRRNLERPPRKAIDARMAIVY